MNDKSRWRFEFCSHAFSHGSGYVIYAPDSVDVVAFTPKNREKVAAAIVDACNSATVLRTAEAERAEKAEVVRERDALRAFIEKHTYVEYGGYKQSCIPHCIACGETLTAYGGSNHKDGCELVAALAAQPTPGTQEGGN